MASPFLNSLSKDERKSLESKLFNIQKGSCFICEQPIDLKLHAGSLDIDHVEPLKMGGKDTPDNFAITHAHCNRAKQASDLRLARVLSKFSRIRQLATSDNRSANLEDVLHAFRGDSKDLSMSIEGSQVRYSFSELQDSSIHSSPLYTDDLSGMTYFFANLPIKYLSHDDRINPRPIGSSINSLVEEFHSGRPQLHSASGWANYSESLPKTKIQIFDGQHKIAAQVLLGVKSVPVRVFLNPNIDILLTANTNAGTTLRQVAFDKSVQRHLGNALFWDRVDRYRRERSLSATDESFSERDLVNHFKGESREMRRYVIDAVRDSITHDPKNKLRDFVEYGGKGKDRPLSYSSIEKTFYSFFIYGEMLD